MQNARPVLKAVKNADMDTKPKKVQTTTALSAVHLFLPKTVMLRQDGERVMVSWPAKQHSVESRLSSEGCLLAFLELAQASEEQILKFTMDWGLLLIEKVQHQYKDEEQFIRTASPVTLTSPAVLVEMLKHTPAFQKDAGEKYERQDKKTKGEYQWKKWPVDWDCEAVSVYRQYAVQARALLQIAAQVTRNEPAALELWQQAVRPDAPNEFQWPEANNFKQICRPNRDLEVQRHLLGKLVTGWVEKSSLRPQFIWLEEDSPQVVLNAGIRYDDNSSRDSKLWHSERALFRQGETSTSVRKMPLFNVLTLQLLAMLTSRNGLHVCSGEGCTNVFAPETRKPRYDQGRYCSNECRENATRRRAREHNRKKQTAKSQ